MACEITCEMSVDFEQRIFLKNESDENIKFTTIRLLEDCGIRALPLWHS